MTSTLSLSDDVTLSSCLVSSLPPRSKSSPAPNEVSQKHTFLSLLIPPSPSNRFAFLSLQRNSVVKEIQRVNAREASAQRGEFRESASWHSQYKDSAYVFIGGCPFELTEGDLICIFSQFGEVVDVNLVRDKDTGKSKGFAFLAYEDQRSTVLAVDNLNGSKVR